MLVKSPKLLIPLAVSALVVPLTCFAARSGASTTSPSGTSGASASPVASGPPSPPSGGVPYTSEPPGTASALPAGTPPQDPDQCTLYASVVHQRSNQLIVGNKPYTRCTAGAPSSISQLDTVYKQAFFGPSEQGVFPGPGNRNESSYTQTNVEVICTNTKSTNWYAVVTGTIVENGTTYYAGPVQTPVSSWPCGT